MDGAYRRQRSVLQVGSRSPRLDRQPHSGCHALLMIAKWTEHLAFSQMRRHCVQGLVPTSLVQLQFGLRSCLVWGSDFAGRARVQPIHDR